MNVKTKVITSIAKNFIPVSKALSKDTVSFLNERSLINYQKLEITLKAIGYTVEQYFKCLSDNTNDIELVSTFMNTSAICAKINIIINSTEFTDFDKMAELDKIIAVQAEQMHYGCEENRKKRKDTFDGIFKIMVFISGAYLMGSKNSMPGIAKTIKRITKK